MKSCFNYKRLLLSLAFTPYFFARSQDSTALVPFTSLHGTTGVYKTADAATIGKGKGSVGLFENTRYDSLDQLVFVYGVHEKLEVGIQSDIPAHSSRLNFLFKFQGTPQGNFFGIKKSWLPSTAIGFNRHSTFAVASYGIKKLMASVGYHFSDGKQSVFSNATYQPFSFLALQAEYFKDYIGAALRIRYRKFVGGMFTSYHLREKNFSSARTCWNIAFYF